MQAPRPAEVKQEKKKDDLDDNRKKSRSILLEALVQGMKQDEHTRMRAVIAKREINVIIFQNSTTILIIIIIIISDSSSCRMTLS